MQFIFRLLALPFTGPANGLKFVLEQIREQALAEMPSEAQIESMMIESSLQHQAGEITDEELEEIETRLLEELRTIRQLNQPPAEDVDVSDAVDDYTQGERYP